MDYFQFHSDADNEEVGYQLTYLRDPFKCFIQVGSMLKEIDTKDDLEVLA